MKENSSISSHIENAKVTTNPTKEKITRVSKTLFAAEGFPSCGIRSIAKAAGVNIASINYYFDTKENLFRSVLIESIEEITKEMLSWRNSAPDQITVSLNKLYQNHPCQCELLVQGILIENSHLSEIYLELKNQLGEAVFSQILGLILLKKTLPKYQRPTEITV